MPERAGEWTTRTLSFDDRPEDTFTIRYRDPIEAIRSLWGDPGLAKDFVYAPQKIFADDTKQTRIFNEMWTGKWWHVLQVRPIFFQPALTFSKKICDVGQGWKRRYCGPRNFGDR